MNEIIVNDVGFEICPEVLEPLVESGALLAYAENGGRYHLNPEHQFTIAEVIMLMSPGEPI